MGDRLDQNNQVFEIRINYWCPTIVPVHQLNLLQQ